MQAETSPARSLQLAGAPNFRDLGGYRGLDGRRVAWRRIFRSDHLGALTTADVATLTRTGGRAWRVCDLRGVAERAQAPCVLAGAAVHSLPIEPTVVQQLNALREAGHTLDPARTVALMQQTYRAFAVFHCTAGKDRTGFAAALVLLALGVPREEVLHDYLLTNIYYSAVRPLGSALPEAVLDVLYGVQEAFLLAAFEAAEQDCGSLWAWLSRRAGVGTAERERLAARYLL
jgi:protein-tyrosine phosphatase